ncbi:MAG: replication and repair protein RecF [Bacteroidota bacterium]|jgi:predicted ATP-binding protein involved in virulence
MQEQALYIAQLEINRFKCFKGENSLSLTDEQGDFVPWTVIMGNNNSGKTTFLKAVAGLQPVEKKLILTKKDNSNTFEVNTFRVNTFRLNKEYEMISCSGWFDVDKKYTISNLDFTQFSGGKIYENTKKWTAVARLFQLYAYGVTRKSGNDISLKDNGNVTNVQNLFEPEKSLINIEEYLLQLDYAAKNGQEAAKKRLKILRNLIIEDIFPEVTDFKFVTNDKLENYVEFQTQNGWYRLSELGYGYQAMLSWMVDFCKKMFERYPNSETPLKEPAIVLLDEIDLHLHPKWQRTIIPYLSKIFPKTQFIVTTHSPLILHGADNVNVFILEKDKKDESVHIRKLPYTSFQGWNVQEILEEAMEMVNDVNSERYQKLQNDFAQALDSDDYEKGKAAYDALLQILHPQNVERKLLSIQLSQLSPEAL